MLEKSKKTLEHNYIKENEIITHYSNLIIKRIK